MNCTNISITVFNIHNAAMIFGFIQIFCSYSPNIGNNCALICNINRATLCTDSAFNSYSSSGNTQSSSAIGINLISICYLLQGIIPRRRSSCTFTPDPYVNSIGLIRLYAKHPPHK